MRHGFRGRTVVAALVFVAVGCDDGGDGDGDKTEPFELAGEWTTAFGSETITATSWKSFDSGGTLSFEQKVTRFDNAANVAIVQNLPDAEFGPNTYGKVLWLDATGTGVSYCTVAYGHESVDGAANAPEVDANKSDLEAGCAGFPWTTLTKK
ncbi:MAG TPA: hypothetical protein PK095_08245 [Myxococcota bacterium]|nr:hypothetical protein [Myxococcota bacterium]